MRPISSRLTQFAALLFILMWTVAAQAQYTFTTFVAPGATGMQGWGINSALKVPANIAGAGGPFQGYVYDFSSNSFAALPSAGGGIAATAIGINDAGQLTGSYTDGSYAKGFVLTGGVYDTFSYPGSIRTFGRAMNNTGLVAGYAELSVAPLLTTGFIYQPSTGTFTGVAPAGSVFTIAQGINDAGVLVGGSNMVPGAVYPGSPAGPFGWVRQPSGTFNFFRINGFPTRARGINNAGEIVGWYSDAVGTFIKSFKVTVSGALPYEDIAVPAADVIEMAGAEQTIAEGINDAGYISGSVHFADGTNLGFVAAPPGSALIVTLDALIEGFSLPAGTANSLTAKLDAASSNLAAGDVTGACNNLQALINQATAQSGKKLTAAQATQIINSATAIRVSLGC